MNQRKCLSCLSPINECMGFVIARDILTPTQKIPRELCAKCGAKAFMDPAPFLLLIEQTTPVA